MIGPIYTGAEARALRERLADTATSHTRTVTLTSAELAALDAVPRLTASVEHHAERARNAEALAQVHREERDAEHAAVVRLHAEAEALVAAAEGVADATRAALVVELLDAAREHEAGGPGEDGHDREVGRAVGAALREVAAGYRDGTPAGEVLKRLRAEAEALCAVVERQGAALRVVALWLGGPHHNPQPDAVEELARAKGRELDELRARAERLTRASRALDELDDAALDAVTPEAIHAVNKRRGWERPDGPGAMSDDPETHRWVVAAWAGATAARAGNVSAVEVLAEALAEVASC